MLSLDVALEQNSRKRQKLSVAAADKSDKSMAKAPTIKNLSETTTSVNEGFVVQCKGGTKIDITPDKANRFREATTYFGNTLNDVTNDNTARALYEVDWCEDTVRSIISLIINGSCKIPCNYAMIKKAASQIQVDLCVSHPLTGINIANFEDTVQNMSYGWTCRKSQFVLETPLLPLADNRIKWHDLLLSGLVVLLDETDMMINIDDKKKNIKNIGNSEREPRPNARHRCLVGGATPLCISVFHTCFYLGNGNNQDGKSTQFELLFTVNFGTSQYLKHKGVNARSIITKQQEVVQIQGTTHDLLKALGIIEDMIISRASVKLGTLQTSNPSSVTLGRFITASQQCIKYPATLNWKVDSKTFYAFKPVSDLHIMLTALSSPSTVAATSGLFHLKDHYFSKDGQAF